MTSAQGSAVYDRIGLGYAAARRPDHRIAGRLREALGDARRVVNVGAGTGSYEPGGFVVAVEPSVVMIGQRPAEAAPCVQARAEQLPFRDGAFDAALAVLTTHHWTDPHAGLTEMTRVSRRQVVLTWDKRCWDNLWLVRDYLPEIAQREAHLPALEEVLTAWPDAAVHQVPVPADCADGFLAAYWRRPKAYLDPAVRAGISSFSRLRPDTVDRALGALREDVRSGRWHDRRADLLAREELDCGYRLVVREGSA